MFVPFSMPHLSDEGPRDGTAIVFIHALGSTSSLWDTIIDDFIDEYRIIRYNLPCHGGRAPLPPNDATLEAYCDDLLLLLDAVQVARAHIVGVSLGGWSHCDSPHMLRLTRFRALPCPLLCAWEHHRVGMIELTSSSNRDWLRWPNRR